MRAIILAHFDRDGILDPHVVFALQEYRKNADLIVLASATLKVLPPDISHLVDFFVARENIGYDFCSWRDGLQKISNPALFDEIVFLNDSVYGPVFDLGNALNHADIADADIWGMVLSHQSVKGMAERSSPHIQSWFFAMRKSVLQSESFREFWSTVTPQASKNDIIKNYEIGMSRFFANRGFRLKGIYDSLRAPPMTWHEIASNLSLFRPLGSWKHFKKAMRSRSRHNPSELMWERLLDAGVPFVKVNLFRVNHYRLNLDRIWDALSRLPTYDVRLVKNHLKRLQ